MINRKSEILLICAIAVFCVIAFYYPSTNANTLNGNQLDNYSSFSDLNNTPQSNNILTNVLATIVNDSKGNLQKETSSNSSMDHVIGLFDAYVNSTFPKARIPAASIVIVQNDKIVYMNCLGFKDLESGEPIDQNTLFGIGSATKQFSATNIAQYVSNGSISWDDPITKYYPDPNEFKLYSDYVTNNITIRDCLCHRSGLPANGGDDYYTYFNDSYSAALYKLRYMENNTEFRSKFQYNNIIYALPAFSAARANNATWYELIKKDLLEPLGMKTATTTYNDFLNSPNHATPYKLLKNGTLKQYDIIPDPIGPAGSIYSSISEMANWLKFQIADTGQYNGIQIVSKKELDETRTGQIKVIEGAYYGFGWVIQNDTIWHDGDSDSFHSMVTIYPSKDLGIVILSNGGIYADGFRKCLNTKFRELLKGNETSDPWPSVKNKLDASWKPVLPEPPIIDPQPLSTYVGVYSNKIFSNIKITTDNNTLICYYGNDSRPYDLKCWNNNTFEEPTNNHFFNFTDISNGTAHQLTVKLTNTPENVTFNRTNDT